jgi:hypothetical protein
MSYELFSDCIGVFLLFSCTFFGCTYSYVRGKNGGYLKGYEQGYQKGLSDALEDERGRAIIDMLRTNVAKKVEEKLLSEFRNGTRKL